MLSVDACSPMCIRPAIEPRAGEIKFYFETQMYVEEMEEETKLRMAEKARRCPTSIRTIVRENARLNDNMGLIWDNEKERERESRLRGKYLAKV